MSLRTLVWAFCYQLTIHVSWPQWLDHFFISLLMFLCGQAYYQCMWQITDDVVAPQILNATLVVPKLDQKSFWKDARFVVEWKIFAISILTLFGHPYLNRENSAWIDLSSNSFNFFMSSNFSEIFDIDWFISFLSKDVKIIKQLPKRGGRTWTPYTMRVPRKCSERCYQNHVLPVLLKRHVSSLFLKIFSQFYTCSP